VDQAARAVPVPPRSPARDRLAHGALIPQPCFSTRQGSVILPFHSLEGEGLQPAVVGIAATDDLCVGQTTAGASIGDVREGAGRGRAVAWHGLEPWHLRIADRDVLLRGSGSPFPAVTLQADRKALSPGWIVRHDKSGIFLQYNPHARALARKFCGQFEPALGAEAEGDRRDCLDMAGPILDQQCPISLPDQTRRRIETRVRISTHARRDASPQRMFLWLPANTAGYLLRATKRRASRVWRAPAR
jgi:hypothetical protein